MARILSQLLAREFHALASNRTMVKSKYILRSLADVTSIHQSQLQPLKRSGLVFRCYSGGIDEGPIKLKPTPFQQRVLVWSKMYPSTDKVPERVTRGQMKKSMDIFRVRASIIMAAMVLIFSAIMAMIGRRERQQGQSLTKLTLERRQH